MGDLTSPDPATRIVDNQANKKDQADMQRRLAISAWAVCLMLGSCAASASASRDAQAAACPGQDSRLTGQWFQAPAAFEHADSGRSHVFRSIPVPSASDIKPGTGVRASRWDGLPGVYNLAVRAPGEAYALGGVTGAAPGLAPFVARLSPDRPDPVWQTPLRAQTPEGQWTYPGVIGIAANGNIFAVQDAALLRLDPETGEITGRLDLPVSGEARNTAYNGFVAFPDGSLVMKSHHRPPGCGVDGFQAFVRCGTDGAPPSVFAVVDPEKMTIVATAMAPELIGGRITSAQFEGRNLVYAPGLDNVHRYEWKDGALTYDGDWGPLPYRREKETPATAAGILGEFIILQTNSLPSDAPTRLIAISQRDPGRTFEITPFEGSARSFIPSMPSIDTDTGQVFVTDGLAPGLAAFRFDPETGFEKAWQAAQGSLSFSALIGPKDDRILISTDMADGYRIDFTREMLVWREASTGLELARSAPIGRLGGTVIAPDCEGVVYAPSPREGAVHQLNLILPGAD